MANDTVTVTQTVNTISVDDSSPSTLTVSSDSGGTVTLSDNTPRLVTVSISPVSSTLTLESNFAPKESPIFTGSPTAPTPSAGDNSTRLATTAFVSNSVSLQNTLSEMTDVNITSISDNELLQYDTATSKWINQTLAEAGVASSSALSSHTSSTSNPHNVTASQIGLGNVTDESKATMFTDSVFTGNPTAVTQTAGNNSTRLATTAFVGTAISNLIGGAGAALDTLVEIETALGSNPNLASTLTNSIATKAPLASPALTGTPTAPTASAGTNTTQLATTAFVTAAVSLKDSLAELNDVAISNISDGELIQYNAGGWHNVTLTEAGILPLAGGTMTGNLTLSYAYPRINLTDTNNDSDYSIINNDGSFSIYDVTNASHRFLIAADGNATFAADVTASNLFVSNNAALKANGSGYLELGNTNSGVIQVGGDGTDSTIAPRFNNLKIQTSRDADDIIFLAGASTTELLRLDASATSVNIPDNVELFFGGANDFSIKHGPNNTHHKNFSGDFYISNDAANKDLIFRASDGTLNELLRLDGSASSIRIPDTVYLQVGSSSDLGIAFDGTNSIISNVTNDLNIQNYSSTGDINIQATNGSGGVVTYLMFDGSQQQMKANKNLVFYDNKRLRLGTSADADLYSTNANVFYDHNNYDALFRHLTADKDFIFSTTPSGGSLTELLRLDGSASSVNIPDNVQLNIGSGIDLIHNSTNGFVKNTVGDLYIENTANDKDIIFKSDDGSGGTAEYFRLDGSLGTVPYTVFPDSSRLTFGNSTDLQLFHHNNVSYISNAGVGNLVIRNLADDQDIVFQNDDGSGGYTEYFRVDGESLEEETIVEEGTGTLTEESDSEDKILDPTMNVYSSAISKLKPLG
jgi:hypothetical protein